MLKLTPVNFRRVVSSPVPLAPSLILSFWESLYGVWNKRGSWLCCLSLSAVSSIHAMHDRLSAHSWVIWVICVSLCRSIEVKATKNYTHGPFNVGFTQCPYFQSIPWQISMPSHQDMHASASSKPVEPSPPITCVFSYKRNPLVQLPTIQKCRVSIMGLLLDT